MPICHGDDDYHHKFHPHHHHHHHFFTIPSSFPEPTCKNTTNAVKEQDFTINIIIVIVISQKASNLPNTHNVRFDQIGRIFASKFSQSKYFCIHQTQYPEFVSSDRSSYSDDGLLYIYTSGHFFRFSLSPLMQLMLQVSL